ncbi:MAG: hypothetical protein IPN38_15540 [Flavobacteriales bacterium]|nr:hypothetical protein [Flavobacteriales bacterium]
MLVRMPACWILLNVLTEAVLFTPVAVVDDAVQGMCTGTLGHAEYGQRMLSAHTSGHMVPDDVVRTRIGDGKMK